MRADLVRPGPHPDVRVIALRDAQLDDLERLSRNVGWGLKRDELASLQETFRGYGRDPTDIEVEAIAQGWSEHCCYKSSKPVLRKHIFGLFPEKSILREDAGVVPFDDEHVYAIKMESHNHPSAIEPYGGAATGVGGILRDIVCMGAQPVALADMLFFGPPGTKPPKGTKDPVYLFHGVVAGIRDYGNRVGIPNVAGSITFHPGYTANCLVNAGCVGVGKRKHVTPSRAGPPGSVYLLAGGRTGRDGIHGVTFASRELTEDSHVDVPAVQLGDPITKEPLMHACLELIEAGLVLGMKDLGGGGLSCAVGEMSHAAGNGCAVNLERVPTKASGLVPWEVWVSESQERMLLSVAPANVAKVLSAFNTWDVLATTIGETTSDGRITAFWHGAKVFDLPPEVAYEGPEYERPMRAPPARAPKPAPEMPKDPDKFLLSLLGHPDIACRAPVVRQYDHMVRGQTAVPPLVGLHDGHGDAAVIKPLEGSYRGLAVACGTNPFVGELDPYQGALHAVDEVARNLAAVGAVTDTMTDNLNLGNPERPERMWEIHETIRGLADGAKALRAPFVSGNVSLYNEGPSGAIPPTPTLLGVGILPDVRKTVTTRLTRGDLLLVGAPTQDALAGSLLSRILGGGGPVPTVDLARLGSLPAALAQAIQAGVVTACHDVGDGGAAAALCEMAIAGGTGFSADLARAHGNPAAALFGESPTRWIVQVGEGARAATTLQDAGLPVAPIGSVGGREIQIRHGNRSATMPLELAEERWRGGLARTLEQRGWIP